MTPYNRSFRPLVALLVMVILALSGFAGSGSGSGSSQSDFHAFVAPGVDQDTADCVAGFFAYGTTAAEILARGYRADAVIQNEDGTVTNIYRQVRYAVKRGGRGHGTPVRVIGGLGTDLSVTFKDGKVDRWSLKNLKT